MMSAPGGCRTPICWKRDEPRRPWTVYPCLPVSRTPAADNRKGHPVSESTTRERDAFADAVRAIAGSDVLLNLDQVARILKAPSRDAMRHRILRGKVPLRTIQTGGVTSELLVPAADVFAVLGLDWEPPTEPALVTVNARVMPDGSLQLVGAADEHENCHHAAEICVA